MTATSVDAGRNALMLTELRLPTIARLWPELAQRSDKEGWPAGRFLGGLLEHEVAERAKRRTERHRAESQLDATKTLASFDFAEVPMLSKAHVMALAGGGAWLDKGATVLIFGPPGVGKSHVGCGIGHALIDAGYRVLYMRTSELVQRLQAARHSLQRKRPPKALLTDQTLMLLSHALTRPMSNSAGSQGLPIHSAISACSGWFGSVTAATNS